MPEKTIPPPHRDHGDIEEYNEDTEGYKEFSVIALCALAVSQTSLRLL